MWLERLVLGVSKANSETIPGSPPEFDFFLLLVKITMMLPIMGSIDITVQVHVK